MGSCPVSCTETPQGLGGSGGSCWGYLQMVGFWEHFSPMLRRKAGTSCVSLSQIPPTSEPSVTALHFWKLPSMQTHCCVTNSEKGPPKIVEMQRSPVGLADILPLSSQSPPWSKVSGVGSGGGSGRTRECSSSPAALAECLVMEQRDTTFPQCSHVLAEGVDRCRKENRIAHCHGRARSGRGSTQS